MEGERGFTSRYNCDRQGNPTGAPKSCCHPERREGSAVVPHSISFDHPSLLSAHEGSYLLLWPGLLRKQNTGRCKQTKRRPCISHRSIPSATAGHPLTNPVFAPDNRFARDNREGAQYSSGSEKGAVDQHSEQKSKKYNRSRMRGVGSRSLSRLRYTMVDAARASWPGSHPRLRNRHFSKLAYSGVPSTGLRRWRGQWGRHGFDGIACGTEACWGVGTHNRLQN
jgi:hypothetical protein